MHCGPVACLLAAPRAQMFAMITGKAMDGQWPHNAPSHKALNMQPDVNKNWRKLKNVIS